MKVDIVSDIHVEFNGTKYKQLLENSTSKKIIIAGDMGPILNINVEQAFVWLANKYDEVIYVPGNHDYYGTSLTSGDHALDTMNDILPNLTILKPGRSTKIGDKKVIGSTLWFPYHQNLKTYPISDSYQIKYLFDPPGDVLQLNKEHKKWFLEQADENTIIVCHHQPSPLCIAPEFLSKSNEPYNCWFVSDETYMIENKKPYLIVYGHTHTRNDFMIGSTRLINNAYGYPREFRPFKQITFDIG